MREMLRRWLQRLVPREPYPVRMRGPAAQVAVNGHLVATVPLAHLSDEYLNRITFCVGGLGPVQQSSIARQGFTPYAHFTFGPASEDDDEEDTDA